MGFHRKKKWTNKAVYVACSKDGLKKKLYIIVWTVMLLFVLMGVLTSAKQRNVAEAM
jgi:hypothetical protein